MRKIVIVNQSSNYLTSDIAKAFTNSQDFDKVVVITGNPQSLVLSENDNIHVDTITPYNKKSINARFRSWIIGTFQVVWKAWTKYKGYEFLLVSNPPTIHLFRYLCSNRYSTLIYDVYPDGIATGGFVKRSNVIFKVWGGMAKTFYKKAVHVYAISEGIAKKVSQYCTPEKIEVIPLWSNKYIHRVERTENIFVKKYNLSEKFIILYSGNIGRGSNIKVLVELAKTMKSNKRVQFVIIGEGMEKTIVENAIKDCDLDNILLLPYQPLEYLSHSLSSADLAYVSVENRAANVCIPSKTFNLLNVEVPLLCIASPNAEIAKLINKSEIGKVFCENEIFGMSVFVNSLIDDKDTIARYKANIKKIRNEYTSSNAQKFVK